MFEAFTAWCFTLSFSHPDEFRHANDGRFEIIILVPYSKMYELLIKLLH
jgi:hypothetical protein